MIGLVTSTSTLPGACAPELVKRPFHMGVVAKRKSSKALEPYSAAPFVPSNPTLRKLKIAAAACTSCPLWRTGNETVFGEGKPSARVMFIGEQPGHEEDLQGKPFVGPAGKLLDRCLVEAGMDRDDVYVTNAVKHFKWEPAGKRRLHKKPSAREIAACRPWLEAEIHVLKPKVIVALGATGAQTLLGKDFRVTKHRGEWMASDLAPKVIATVHPSSILRAPDDETRRAETARFIDDLKKVAVLISSL